MMTLSIILVNFRNVPDTVECVSSLRESTLRDREVIVIDNASNEASERQLRDACPDARVIPVGENVGFAEACNLGIGEAMARDPRYVLLLNNDTTVAPWSLAALVDWADQHADAGVVGGKILYADPRGILWYAGGTLAVNAAKVVHRGLGERDRGQYEESEPCTFVTGCCMLLRTEMLRKVGVLDARYFAYLEDADLCTRARRSGFQVWYHGRAVVYHKVSRSARRDSPLYVYFNLRNRVLFLRKNATIPGIVGRSPQILHYYLRQAARAILVKRNRASRRAVWWGVADGFRGRWGHHGEGRAFMLDRT